jgi:hypothetical protein
VNPRTIRWQAGVSFGLLLLTALVVGPWPVFWLAGSALLWVIFFNARYAYELGARGRSERRMIGDRWVARFLALGLLAPLLVAVALDLFGWNPHVTVLDFDANEIAAIVISAALLFILIICSSTVDWYYIRPRIDGVFGTPPCRSSGSINWKTPTRMWYLHRAVALSAYFGFALAFAVVVMLMLVREDPAAASVIGGVGGIAGILLIFAGDYREELFSTTGKFVLSPAYCLGDDLSWRNGRIRDGRGYVLHVAVPVAKLVPLDDDGMPCGPPFIERKNSDLKESELESRPTVACAEGCAHLNPECVIGSKLLDQRRRLAVI